MKRIGGQSMEFDLTGKRLSAIDGYIATTCVPTHGPPLSFSSEFSPPGSFALGKTRKASRTEYMSYKGDVTKYYTVAIKRAPGKNRWIGKIHLNFSYEELAQPARDGRAQCRGYESTGYAAALWARSISSSQQPEIVKPKPSGD